MDGWVDEGRVDRMCGDGWRVTEGCMMGERVDEWTTGWLGGWVDDGSVDG